MAESSVQITQADVTALPSMANGVFPGIPARKGLPLIGDAIPFFRDTLAFNRACFEEFGPVFSTRMGPESQVFLCHPDAARLLLLVVSGHPGAGHPDTHWSAAAVWTRDYRIWDMMSRRKRMDSG